MIGDFFKGILYDVGPHVLQMKLQYIYIYIMNLYIQGNSSYRSALCGVAIGKAPDEGPQPRSQKCLFLRPQKQAPCRARLPELGL